MRRLLLCLSVLTANSYAQFHDLAASDDGSQVYFATSLRLASELSLNLPPTQAIYRITSDGTVERFSTPPPFDSALPVSHGNPQLSGDGSVVSYTVTQSCVGGSSCFLSHPATYFSYLFVNGQQRDGPRGGSAQISRNGRYVFSYGAWSSMASGSVVYDDLFDLQTGRNVQLSFPPASNRQALTSTGGVLGIQPDRTLLLWRPQTTRIRKIAPAEPAQIAMINDAATRIVYTASCDGNGNCHLRSLDLLGGADTLISSSATTAFPSISNDGSVILYLAAPQPGQAVQAWLYQPDSGSPRQLTSFEEGVDEAVLNGLGTAVIAATGGRLVKIDTKTGAVTELIGRTPVCNAGFTALIPGSILPINASGVVTSAQTAPTPLPTSLAGVRVLMNATPLPILSVAPGQIWFQVPFELSPGPTVSVRLDHSSLFEGCPAVQVPIVARQPYFVQSSGYLTLAHQDFGSLVTHDSPVTPGEIVHAYAVGLGAVTPPMQTGIVTPGDPLHPLADPFDCFIGFGSGGPPVRVPFAGLAPGLIGIYQVDVQMPAALPSEDFLLNCGSPGNVAERQGGLVWVR